MFETHHLPSLESWKRIAQIQYHSDKVSYSLLESVQSQLLKLKKTPTTNRDSDCNEFKPPERPIPFTFEHFFSWKYPEANQLFVLTKGTFAFSLVTSWSRYAFAPFNRSTWHWLDPRSGPTVEKSTLGKGPICKLLTVFIPVSQSFFGQKTPTWPQRIYCGNLKNSRKSFLGQAAWPPSSYR